MKNTSYLVLVVAVLGSVCLTGCSGGRYAGGPVAARSSGGGGRLRPTHLPDVVIKLPAEVAPHALFDSASQLEQQGEYSRAAKLYRQASEIDPNNVNALHRLAVVHDKQRQFAKAENIYRQLALKVPTDPNLFNDWGYSYYLQKNYDQASRYFQRAVRLDSNHVRARCNLALSLGQMGRLDEAKEHFVRAGLPRSDVHCQMAYIHWNKGDLLEARYHLHTACEMNDSSTKAREMLVRIEEQLDVSPIPRRISPTVPVRELKTIPTTPAQTPTVPVSIPATKAPAPVILHRVKTPPHRSPYPTTPLAVEIPSRTPASLAVQTEPPPSAPTVPPVQSGPILSPLPYK